LNVQINIWLAKQQPYQTDVPAQIHHIQQETVCVIGNKGCDIPILLKQIFIASTEFC
jgi:hypothetical protein